MAVIRQRTTKAARGIESSGRSPCRSLRNCQNLYLENLRRERLAKEDMCLERAETSVSQLKTTISTSFPSLLEKVPGIQRSGQAGTGFEKRQNLPSRGNGSGKGELSLDEFPPIVFHTV